jgi:Zn-dependent protease with chaperone function
MGDLTIALGAAENLVDSFGRMIVERFSLLNLWTAALLAGAFVLDRALSRRARASLRIALYAPVGLRVLLPLDWSIGLAGGPGAATLIAPLLEIGASSDIAPSSWHRPSWYALAATIYVAIAVLLAARAIMARVRLGRAVAEACPVAAPLPGVACSVVQHEDLGPMAVGLLAPRIVLPRLLLAPGEERALAYVLRHEAAHLRRRDAWLSTAMLALAITSWPVVPLWIAMTRVRQLMELACDEAALVGADATERRRYGHTLLDIAEWRSLASASFGAGELHFGSMLRARIEAIVSQRHWPPAVQTLALSVASVALFLACGGSAAPPAPPAGLDPKGYGYEFATDTKEEVTAAPRGENLRRTNEDGRMAPQRIQAKVRGHFGGLLTCYEAGRQRDPKLTGIVTVKFVIGEDGVPKNVADENSTLPDKDVVGCVLGMFRKLQFDESNRGNVNVVYPIKFAP